MRFFRFFIHLILLITTPSLLASAPSNQVTNKHSDPLYYSTYDEFLDLLDRLESGELEKVCSEEDLDRLCRMLASLSLKGIMPNETREELENEIREFLEIDPREISFNSYEEATLLPAIYQGTREIIHCNWVSKKWKHIRRYAHKHKKGIIIAVATVAAVTVVACAVVAASTAATAAVAGAAEALSESQEKKRNPSEPEKILAQEEIKKLPEPEKILSEVPQLKETLDERMTLLKEEVIEIPSSKEIIITEVVRENGSRIAHDVVNYASDLVIAAPEAIDKITNLLPESLQLKEGDPFYHSAENFKKNIETAHAKIDDVFSTDLASGYADKIEGIHLGILPAPGNLTKLRDLIKAGGTRQVAEEIGFSRKQIAQLEKTGSLEKTVSHTVERAINEKVLEESLFKHKRAQKFLENYKGQYFPEQEARKLIHQFDIRTFPRPKGIPENYRIRISDRGAGMVYEHPEKKDFSVRVMPGKPHSPWPGQQRPYVIHTKGKDAVDKFGNLVSPNSPKAHIPFEEFIYRE